MRNVVIAALMAVSAGCSSKHYVANYKTLAVVDIVDHIQCEVYHAWYDDYSGDLAEEDWVAAVSLTMQEKVVNSLNPTVKAGQIFREVPPILTIGAGLGLSQAKEQTTTFNFAIKINKIDAAVCHPGAKRPKLEGQIGIAKVVKDALTALKYGTYSQSLSLTEQKTFGKSVEFEIVTAVNEFGPTWSLRRVEGPGGLLSASRTNTNTVDISFSKKAKKEDIEKTARRAQDSNTNIDLKKIKLRSAD